MSRRIFSICILLGLLTLSVLLVTSQGSAQTLTPTPTACPTLIITGTVTGGDYYLSISGATVEARTSDSHYFTTTTVNDGSYILSIPGMNNDACNVVGLRFSAARYTERDMAITSAQLFLSPIVDMYLLAVTPTPWVTPTRTPTVTPVSTNNDVPWPDLIISSITYVGSNPACMNNPKDNVVVTNIGSFPAGTFVVSFSANGAARTPQTVNELGAGQSVMLSFDAGGTVTATADSTGVITETNESNNSLTVTLPVPTQAYTCTPAGVTNTPTRTPTIGPTFTRTRTPTAGGPTATRTRTPTAGPTLTRTPTPVVGVCSPVNGTITAPFTFDGAGTFCWQSTNLGSYINSWNLTTLTINGVDFRNIYSPNSSLPPLINGYWYVNYISTVAYGHFEAK